MSESKQVHHRSDFFKIKPKLIFLFPLLISGFVFAPMAESAFAESVITQEKLVSLAIPPFAEKIVILDLENGKVKTLFIDPILDLAESLAAQSDVISQSILLVLIPLAGLVFFRAEGLEINQSLIHKAMFFVGILAIASMIFVYPYVAGGYYVLPVVFAPSITESAIPSMVDSKKPTASGWISAKDVSLDFSFGYKLFDSKINPLDSLNALAQFGSIDYYLPPAFALPVAVGDLTATAIANGDIRLDWTDASGGGTTSITIGRATNVAFTMDFVNITLTVAGSATTFTDDGTFPLTDGVQFFYKLFQFDGSPDTQVSNIDSAFSDATPPDAPAAVAITSGSVDNVINDAEEDDLEVTVTLTSTGVSGDVVTLTTTGTAFVTGAKTATLTGGETTVVFTFDDTDFTDGETPTLKATHADSAGNISAEGGSLALTIDKTPPASPDNISIAHNNAGFPNAKSGSTVTVTFDAEADSTVAGTIDGETATGTVVGTTGTLTLTLSGDETQGSALEFSFVMTDENGNPADAEIAVKGDGSETSVIADFAPPTSSIASAVVPFVGGSEELINVTPPINSSETSIEFGFSATDAISDANDLTFTCQLDKDVGEGLVVGEPEACTSGKQYGTGEGVDPLEEGDYTWTLKATDEAGNEESSPTFSWTVDTTPPTFDNLPADFRIENDTDTTGTVTYGPITGTDVGLVSQPVTVACTNSTINGPVSITTDTFVLGNTTVSCTASDSAIPTNDNTQSFNVTVSAINIDSVDDSTPKWDNTIEISVTAFGVLVGDTGTIDWDDDSPDDTDIPLSRTSTSTSSTGTFTARHTYAAGFTGKMNVTAELVSNPTVATSNNFTINVQKHDVEVFVLEIEDVDLTDSENPSVPFDFNFTTLVTIRDLDRNATADTGDLTLKLITFTGTALNQTSFTNNTESDATAASDGEGASVTQALTADDIDGDVGLQTILAEFAGDDNYNADDTISDDNKTTITKHHTETKVIFVQNVDKTDDNSIVTSVPWDYEFDVTAKLIDLNSTASCGGCIAPEEQTGDVGGLDISYSGSNATGPTSDTEFVTDGSDPEMATTTDTLVADEAGNVSENEGDKKINATFAGDANYINSTGLNFTTITRHYTELNMNFIEDVDLTDGFDLSAPSVPWDFNFTVTATLEDVNATLAATTSGDMTGKIINYTGDALSAAEQPFEFETSSDAFSASHTDEVTAVEAGSVGSQTFTATFSPEDDDVDYVTSFAPNSTEITRHHTNLTLNDIPNVDAEQAIAAVGILVDLNKTASCSGCSAPQTVSETVEGKTITFTVPAGNQSFPDATTEGVTISGPNAGVVVCSDCDDVKVLHLNVTGKVELPVFGKSLKIRFENSSNATAFSYQDITNTTNFVVNVTRGDDFVEQGSEDGALPGHFNDLSIGPVSQGIKNFVIANVTDENSPSPGNANVTSDGSPGPNVGVAPISFIQITNASVRPAVMLEINFTELDVDTGDFVVGEGDFAVPVTLKDGSFRSTTLATSGNHAIPDDIEITADFATDDDFFSSTDSDTFETATTAEGASVESEEGTGGGAGGSIGTFSRTAGFFTDFGCGRKNVDGDGDSACKDWETASTPGIEYDCGRKCTQQWDFFTSSDSQGGAIDTTVLGLDTVKDIWLEIDYMEDHHPNIDAINDVIAAFDGAPENHRLHIQIDEELHHDRNMGIWTDGSGAVQFDDYNVTNDFQSIKLRHFGTTAERANVTTTIFTPTYDSGSGELTIPPLTVEHPVGFTDITAGTITLAVDVAFTSGDDKVKFGKVSTSGGTCDSLKVTKSVNTTAIVPAVQVVISIAFELPGTDASCDTETLTIPLNTDPTTATVTQARGNPTVYTDLIEAKAQVTHYAIWGHNIGTGCGSSGVSEFPGNDFVVSLGCDWGTDLEAVDREPGGDSTVGTRSIQAGTFMHEFGHNFNLNHGGPAGFAGDIYNCKPNYLSVMSYARQTDEFYDSAGGLPFELDYSSGTGGILNEGTLDELTGITIAGFPTIIFADSAGSINADAADGSSINWDGFGLADNAMAASVSVNLNDFSGAPDDPGCSGGGTVLTDNDDWSNLDYNFRDNAAGTLDGRGNVEATLITFNTFGDYASSFLTDSPLIPYETPVFEAGSKLPIKAIFTLPPILGGGPATPDAVEDVYGDGKKLFILIVRVCDGSEGGLCDAGDRLDVTTGSTSGKGKNVDGVMIHQTDGEYRYGWETPETISIAGGTFPADGIYEIFIFIDDEQDVDKVDANTILLTYQVTQESQSDAIGITTDVELVAKETSAPGQVKGDKGPPGGKKGEGITIELNPDGNAGPNEWTAEGDCEFDPNFECVFEGSGHDGDDTRLESSTVDHRDNFTIAAPITPIPAGSTIDSVIAHFVGKDSGSGNNQVELQVFFETNTHSQGGIKLSKNYAQKDFDITSLQAWDGDDFNDQEIKIAIHVTGIGGEGTVSVTAVWLEVLYTPPP